MNDTLETSPNSNRNKDRYFPSVSKWILRATQ